MICALEQGGQSKRSTLICSSALDSDLYIGYQLFRGSEKEVGVCGATCDSAPGAPEKGSSRSARVS